MRNRLIRSGVEKLISLPAQATNLSASALHRIGMGHGLKIL